MTCGEARNALPEISSLGLRPGVSCELAQHPIAGAGGFGGYLTVLPNGTLSVTCLPAPAAPLGTAQSSPVEVPPPSPPPVLPTGVALTCRVVVYASGE